jgi:hypothetical protein
VVTSHGIEGDFHEWGINSGDIDGDDFFSLVVPAIGANAMRQFRAFALGANRKGFRLDFPIGAAFVAALAGMPPFWISHLILRIYVGRVNPASRLDPRKRALGFPAFKGIPPLIGGRPGTFTRFQVQITTALSAQSPAIFPAKGPHGDGQQQSLPDLLPDVQGFPVKINSFHLARAQDLFRRFLRHRLRPGPVVDLEKGFVFLFKVFHTPVANQPQLPGDPALGRYQAPSLRNLAVYFAWRSNQARIQVNSQSGNPALFMDDDFFPI